MSGTRIADRAPAAASALLAQPHHDGSDAYVLERPHDLGDEAVLRLRVPHESAVDRVLLRFVRDGEPRAVEAERDAETETETWWRASFPALNPSTPYRWLLDRGESGYSWVTGRGVSSRDLPDGGDFVLTLDAGGPDWHLGSVVYEIFPDRFATTGAGAGAPLPEWAVRREWDARPEGRSPNTPRELFGGDLPGIEQRLDYIEQLGVNALYLTPVFPAGSTHRYDATSFDRVDPLLGGDAALASLVAAAHVRGIRVIGDLTLNHCGAGHDWFLQGTRGRQLAGARLLLLRRLVPPRLRLVVRREVAAEARPPQPRAAAPLPRRPRVDHGPVAAAAGRIRRLADRRREHGGTPPRPRPHRRARARDAGHDGGVAERHGAHRRARPRLPRRPSGLRLARDDELRGLPAAGLGMAARRRAAAGAPPVLLGPSGRAAARGRPRRDRGDARVPRRASRGRRRRTRGRCSTATTPPASARSPATAHASSSASGCR